MKHGFHLKIALTLTAISLLSAFPAVAGVAKVEGGIEFSYHDPHAGSVGLAGEFNGWDMNATPLEMDEDGTWRVVIALPSGKHEYKFVVNGSEWIADPDNPRVVGDYGNSEIAIGDDGELVAAGVEAAISNTPVSSRVKLNGWYRATYDTRSDVPSDPRWRLDRPVHEIYLSVNPTVTPHVSGSATLRVDTGVGDIKEVSADFYSGHVGLGNEPFSVTGFYNEECLQFDNPLETVGHIDVAGTIPEEHIPFGRGAQGVFLEGEFQGTELIIAYANMYDYDIWNDPSVYDNTDTDLVAGRITHLFDPVTVGITYSSLRDGWWMDWRGSNESAHLNEHVEETGSTSDWFELAQTEQCIGADLAWDVAPEFFGVRAEYAGYSFDSCWDVGNREKIEGETYSNGAIDVPVGDIGGWLGKVVLWNRPLLPLDLKLQIERRAIEGMDADEEYVAFEASPWAGSPLREYTDVRFDNSPFVVNVYGPAPEREEWTYEFDADFTFGIFDFGFEYDRGDYEWTYVESLESIDGTRWEGNRSRIAGHARANILDDRLWLEFEAESRRYDMDEGLWDAVDSRELIFRGRTTLWENWGLLLDLRHMSYYDAPDSTGTSDESFFNPYVAVVYGPRENVELRIGYGVNPTNYTDTPVEGRSDGRERWRDEYMWDHGAASSIDAEQALEDARTIGLMAVISF